MKKGAIVLILICLTLPCKRVVAGERDKLLIGLVGGIGVNKSNNTPNSSMGFFINYSMTKNATVRFELQQVSRFGGNFSHTSTRTNFFDKLLWREWSASVSFNCNLKPIYRNVVPYISVGAGEYFIHDSKSNIKRVREHPEEENLDYDMREYFKRPGFFGALGLQLKASPRTIFFIQSRCSILFDQHHLMEQPSNFTDYISLTTGIRYSLN
ncbi:MAG: hypothetical protein ACE5NG_03230 [bacterium]